MNQIISLIQVRLQEILAAKLVGLYLGGSLVTGDFDIDVSDIDLTAALTQELDYLEFEALREMHAEFAQQVPGWNDRIEVCYVPVDALRNVRTDRRMIVNISPGEPFHWTPLRDEWLVSWYAVRQHGVTLYGPSPTTLIEPISREEFVRCLIDHVQSWSTWIYDMRRRQQQAYAILSMCRALYGIRHGHQVSKQQAASWVAGAYPHWAPLIDHALNWRVIPEDDATDHEATFAKTERFINEIRMEILGESE